MQVLIFLCSKCEEKTWVTGSPFSMTARLTAWASNSCKELYSDAASVGLWRHAVDDAHFIEGEYLNWCPCSYEQFFRV